MIINYSLSESDMLTHQLYLASKSDRIKKKRFVSRVIVPLCYLLLAAWYYYQDKADLAVVIVCLSIVWYFLYPLWERKRYTSHYRAVLKEHFHARVGRPSSLEFKDGAVVAKDNGTESYILAGEITEIVELPQIILIKIVTGEALVIPLDDIENVDTLRSYLKNLVSELKIDYTPEPAWAWK